ncbi:MAG: single-stranded DNA-binding protein [Bifidobacterium sp.]|nr:single-stranded DNA-binding protein [Bifidobacterium sp.]
MAGETILTIIGNLTADPELRTTGDGTAVVNFTIASTPRTYNRNTNQWEDGNALFMRCSAWRDMADHCASSLSKGMRVIAQGRLQQRSYTANDGSNRTVVELTVDEIGPSLRYATAQVTKRNRNGNGYWPGQSGTNNYQGGAGQNAPWNGAQQNGQTNPMPHDPTAPKGSEPDPWGAMPPADEFGGDSDEPEF